MHLIRSVLVLFASVTLGLAAEPAKLRTLQGGTIEGELVRISAKEIVLRGKDGPVATPLMEVLDLELQPAVLPADAKFIDVELTDGTLLHCTQCILKNREVEIKLVHGHELKLPLATVAYMLNDAQDAEVRAEWQRLLSKQGNRDLLAVKKGGVANGLEGTFGEGDAEGKTIGFETSGGQKVRLTLVRVHGMSFFRKLEPGPDPACKVYDTTRNVLVAKSIVPSDTGYTITTLTGLKIEYAPLLLARLDFSKGKLTFLSDLEPVKKVEASVFEGIDRYRRDKNLDGGPLRLDGKTYAKGLAVHAYTELVYDIGGEYKEFKAVLGVDDQVGGDCHVKVTIEGDNRMLYSVEIKRNKEKKVVPVAVDVKNVKQLRIVVSSANLFDLGAHVDFADAKVSK